jgi:hypothetical protein
MAGQDYADLREDIRTHGQREPIWTYQGAIIDGRNRYRVCQELGIEPKLREWDGQGSLVAFVVSLNLHRRHLGSSQRAAVAAEMLSLLEQEAKERQRDHAGTAPGKKAKKHLVRNLTKCSDPNQRKATEQAAKMAGTNRQYVADAAKLKEQAPDLFADLKEGRINVMAARHRLRQRERQKEEEQQPVIVTAAGRLHLTARPSWSSRNLTTLESETRQRPAFVERAAKVERLKELASQKRAEATRLAREASEAERAVSDAQLELNMEVRRTIAMEHGAVVPYGFTFYSISPETKARIEGIEDPAEQREAILNLVGWCEWCEVPLAREAAVNEQGQYVQGDLRDLIPGHLSGTHWPPSARYSGVCDWCWEHRGKTHCQRCGGPLTDEEKCFEYCRQCDPRSYERYQEFLGELEREGYGIK